MLPISAGVEPATSWSPVGRASNWATEAGYIQVYIDIYVRISLGGHNLGTFDARKMKFAMLLTKTKTFNKCYSCPMGHVLGGVRGQNV